VNIDYHIEVERHYYSVPHQLIHKEVEARTTAATVEILFKGSRVWTHVRGLMPGRYTTVTEHMPKSHQQHIEWTPSRIISWAATVGPHTAAMVQKIMESRPHPEHGFRSCLGIMRMGKKYGLDRVEAACARSYAVGAYSYKSVESILKNGLDRQPLKASGQMSLVIDHENVRGPGYYH
jgi:transposase